MIKKSVAACAVVLSTLAPQAAKASDWGCQVLLCLADPRGPETEGACVPPIQKLWEELRKARPKFPTCDMAPGPGGRSYANLGYGWYDPCPDGTTELGAGEYAVKGTAEQVAAFNAAGFWERTQMFAKVPMSLGIGDGSNAQYVSFYDRDARDQKTCVGKKLGTVGKNLSDAQTSSYAFGARSVVAGVYDRVVTMPAAKSPSLINVFIDDKLYKVVRY